MSPVLEQVLAALIDILIDIMKTTIRILLHQDSLLSEPRQGSILAASVETAI